VACLLLIVIFASFARLWFRFFGEHEVRPYESVFIRVYLWLNVFFLPLRDQWIPASAGMTRKGGDDKKGGPGESVVTFKKSTGACWRRRFG